MNARQRRGPATTPPATNARAAWVWVALLAILIVTAAVRVRLLDVPLERDEGEYAYAGQLILQGVPPYESVYNMKFPGIYGVYAVVLAVFGETVTAIHLGLLLANAITIVLIFLLGRRIRDPLTGVVAAGSFALLSVSPSVQGVFANAEHFVILPATAGLLLLLVAVDRDTPRLLFWSGTLLGAAMVVKQHGATFAACAGLYLLIAGMRDRPIEWRPLAVRLIWLASGFFLPLVLMVASLVAAGVFDRFWFWAVDYARSYAGQVPLPAAVDLLRHAGGKIVTSAPLVWLLAGAGLIAAAREPARRLFMGLLVAMSTLAVSVGLYFRPHYFVLALPAAALLAGLAVSVATGLVSRARSRVVRVGLPLALVAVAFGQSIVKQRAFLFEWSPAAVSREVYFDNPFPESVVVADFVRERSGPNDRIAVVGSEPQIYFYSKRRSATGYVYAYPLMEDHPYALEMQEEMIREIEAAGPRFIVYVRVPPSWRQRPASPTRIFEWLEDYQREHYTIVGVVDIFSDETRYRWLPGRIWPPKSDYWIAVMERRDTPHSR